MAVRLDEINFWENTKLKDMSREQWELLCDGCGKCCLHKLEDEDTGELFFTSVACRLLDLQSCRCMDYKNRLKRVSDCLYLTLENEEVFQWLPSTCAYRLLYEGGVLPDWHPLLSSDSEEIHRQQISVRNRVISEDYVHPEDLEEHIVHWVD